MRRCSNRSRRALAAKTLRHYAEDGPGLDELKYDPRSVLVDLMTDLRHLAAQRGVDWEAVVRLADMHFAEEVREERTRATE